MAVGYSRNGRPVGAFKDITGKRFGKLTALRCVGRTTIGTKNRKQAVWLCQCDCGGTKEVFTNRLTAGITKTCGQCPRVGPNLRDITSQKFGMLTALRCIGRSQRGQAIWLCRCDCGSEHEATTNSLSMGNVQSCGCLYRKAKTHGHLVGRRHTPEYRCWSAARNRCFNTKDRQYPDYGGRGIRFCERWSGKKGFANFLADMGPRPSPKHSIDRIDNDGPYSPENCRWATNKEQASNTRANRKLEWNGQTLTLAQWADKMGINYGTLLDRLRNGWTVERALNTPTHKWPRATPEHRKARLKVMNAVGHGKLPRVSTLVCAHCGQPASSYHHHKGYAREHWLDVIPLCRPCHRAEHY